MCCCVIAAIVRTVYFLLHFLWLLISSCMHAQGVGTCSGSVVGIVSCFAVDLLTCVPLFISVARVVVHNTTLLVTKVGLLDVTH